VSAGTVVATSAEGVGDMPSSAPVTSADSSSDDAQPFSEVLSRSSAAATGPSGGSPPPPESPVPDETRAPGDGGPAPTPTGRHTRDAGGERSPRGSLADGAIPRGEDVVGPLVSLPETATTAAGDSSDADATAVDIGASAADPSQDLPPSLSSLVALAAEGTQPSSTTEGANPTSDGQSVHAAGTAIAGHGVVSPGATQDSGPGLFRSATPVPLPPGAGGAGSSQAQPPGDAALAQGAPIGEGVPDVRVAAEDGLVTLPSLHLGPVRTQVNASSPGPTATGPSAAASGGPAPSASTVELGALEELPDDGGVTAGATIDIGGLASSITRPLAAGAGDYSVQVSLHPPELGEVRALLSLQGDVLHVTLTPEHATGFEALSDAMPALHDQLAGGGVEVNVTLGQPGSSPGEENGRKGDAGATDGASSDDATSAAVVSTLPLGSGDPGRLHLVL
jgi:flagellar hook-length control protein FliK